MSTFSYSIKTAFFLFPLVALLFTLPYILWQYHKYGSISSYRSIIIYSFLLYLMCAYFLVILPLPSIEAVSKMSTPSYNLKPFHFISEILDKTNFHVSDFATYFPTMKNPVFYEAFFNMLLTLPFGVYLHYYFKCDLKQTFFYSFCFSLFFELTQLSGLYFIYPRSYRVFDVDDLIINTIGGTVGYFVASILLIFLPSREEIDKKSLQKGANVSFLKRTIAFLVDFSLYFVFSTGIIYLINEYVYLNKKILCAVYILNAIIYYIFLPKILKEKTVGMQFLKLKFTTKKEKITWYHYFIYYFIFLIQYIVLPISFIIFGFILYKNQKINEIAWEYFQIIVGVLTLMIYIIAFLKRIFKEELLYEKISKIKIKSTIK